MAGNSTRALGLVSAAMLIAALAGCGGDGSSSSTTEPTGSEQAQAPAGPQAKKGSGGDKQAGAGQGAAGNGKGAGAQGAGGGANGGSGASSRGFKTLGSLRAGRHRASEAEREAASSSLEAFMVGRAAGDWEAVCETLSAAMLELVEELVPVPEGCPEDLGRAAEGRTIWDPENTMNGPIDILLVAGGSGYAVYHGKHGADYLVQMVREDGVWKVDTLQAMSL